MKLENAKVNFLGDSITQGHGSSCTEKNYVSLLKEKYHLAAARNYGVGGTRIAKKREASPIPEWDQDFCLRAEAMDPDADLVLVFGGTNDFGHGDAPLGKSTDRTKDTFYGALHVLMTTLLRRYPESEIVFVTPLHRLNEDDPYGDGKKEKSSPLKSYVEAIRETASYYSIPVIDLYGSSGLQPRVEEIGARYFIDGLHPNDAGYQRIADRIGNFLENL